MQPISYGDLAELRGIPAGASIIAAVDQLSPLHREAMNQIWEQLDGAGHRLLNHPTRSLQRYALLRKLYEAGRNQFQVFRANESRKVERFPVFLREADNHTGSLTPLLDSRIALEQALVGLQARGYQPDKLLIVEFCDARDSDGLVRKYAAFRVGDHILPKSFMIGDQWMLKEETVLPDSKVDERRVWEGQNYIRTNPHEAWIRETFDLAQIEYGRIDYGCHDGKLQVWEINTDPTIGRPPRKRRVDRDLYRSIRKTGQDLFHQQFRSALRGLDSAETVAELAVDLSPTLRRRLRGELRRQTIGGAIGYGIERVLQSRVIRQLKPVLAPAAEAVAPIVSRIPRGRAV